MGTGSSEYCRVSRRYHGLITAARDELRRLVEALPDEQVHTVLAEVGRLAEEPPEVAWPPLWFSSITTGRSDTSMRVDEILTEGFGR
jgi:hypothetical protein